MLREVAQQCDPPGQTSQFMSILLQKICKCSFVVADNRRSEAAGKFSSEELQRPRLTAQWQSETPVSFGVSAYMAYMLRAAYPPRAFSQVT